MPKKPFIIILAICIALMPFLGFPSSWENVFYTVAGILIVLLSVQWNFVKKKKGRPGQRRRVNAEKATGNETYVESAPKMPVGEQRNAD